MLKRTLFAAFVLLVCAGLAQAQPAMSFKMTGNLPSANVNSYGYNSYGYGSVWPVVLENNGPTVYLASWSACVYNPAPVCAWIQGIAPASAIKSQASKRVTVDLDISMLANAMVTGIDCSAGLCVWTPPATFPFKGTFTSNAGAIGSHEFRATGNSDSIYYGYGFISTYQFSGNRSDESANFAGTIGPVAVTAPPMGSNGSIMIQKGNLKVTQRQVPLPPLPTP